MEALEEDEQGPRVSPDVAGCLLHGVGVRGLKAVGLTVPHTTQLLWELSQEGCDVPLDALSDEACASVLAGLLRP